MAQQTPVQYDPSSNVHRPISAGDVLVPSLIPVSATVGNRVQIMSDGIYIGDEATLALYVDVVGGSDSNPGTKAAPFQTLDHALTALNSIFPGGVYRGYGVVLALHAGQTHSHSVDFVLGRDHQLILTYYADSKYGDFNSSMVNGVAYAANMQDLQRPVISPVISQTQTLWKIAGFNLQGGELIVRGIDVELPAAPSSPGIGLYSGLADYFRTTPGSGSSTLSLEGVVANMTDPNSFWGIIGASSRSQLSINQFGTQFKIQGQLLTSGTAWPTSQLAQRQYFIKFYADYAGNNQTVVPLSPTSGTSSNGSGLIFVSWSDTEALLVTTGSTSQQSFPLSFQSGYGLIQYVYGVNRTTGGALLNLISSRLI